MDLKTYINVSAELKKIWFDKNKLDNSFVQTYYIE